MLQILAEAVYPRGGWFRAISYIFHRLRRLPDKPHRIARGVAMGIFISFTPFFGFHLLFAAGLSWLCGGNIIAALLATLVGNPLTFPFIMEGAVELGSLILHQHHGLHLPTIVASFGRASAELWENGEALLTGGTPHWEFLARFFERVFWPYLVGGIPPGVIAGAVGYYLSLPMVQAYQKRRARKLQARKTRERGRKPGGKKAVRAAKALIGQRKTPVAGGQDEGTKE